VLWIILISIFIGVLGSLISTLAPYWMRHELGPPPGWTVLGGPGIGTVVASVGLSASA
jgi:hypothetical protein